MLPRYKRALSEPIDFELVEMVEKDYSYIFNVSGSTGKEYIVSIKREKKSECTCQDFTLRKKMCKHIICILMKHFTFNLDKIRELENNPDYGLDNVPSSVSLPGEACPVCFQDCGTVEWNCQQCQKIFHYTCISQWFEILSKQNMQLSCPMCRHVV